MSIEKELQDGFKRLKERGISTFSGDVIGVDKKEGTCSINDGEIEYTDVRLASVVNGRNDVFYIFPKIGSSVLVSPINEDLTALYVESYSEIEEMLLNIGTTKLQVTDEGFVIECKTENLGKVLDETFDEIKKTFTQNGLAFNIPIFEALKLRLNSILIE